MVHDFTIARLRSGWDVFQVDRRPPHFLFFSDLMSKPMPPSSIPPRTSGRTTPPRPPSTAPPNRALGRSSAGHEVFVRIANLQMSRVRQARIRAALQGQVDRCTANIESINAQIHELYRQAGLETSTPEDAPSGPRVARDDDAFEYKY